MREMIDFVVTWVNGNDPLWRSEKNRYISKPDDDNRSIRYRDWNNLQYLFRGMEKYTPWVNKVYFVTWGHVPQWLNKKHPNLKIVKHEDFIPKKYLPTFNSHTIELNLHRIKGLSDHFVYFNDDTFILKELPMRCFFKNNLPCDSAVLMPNISIFRNSTACIVANNMEIINTLFKKNRVIKKNAAQWFNLLYGKNMISTICLLPFKLFAGFNNPHLPNSFLKETYTRLWKMEKKVLHNTCLNKFRSGRDVNQWLFRYWQLVTGNFVPRRISIGKCFSVTNDNSEIVNAICNQRFAMICINDNAAVPIYDFEKEKNIINDAFKKVFPEKSSYEI